MIGNVPRRTTAAALLVVSLGAWAFFVLLHTGMCPLEVPRSVGTAVIALTTACCLGAALVGGGGSRLGGAVGICSYVAGLSFVLLARASYVDPLPGSAGGVGIGLILICALGAGLVIGLRWAVVLALPATLVGYAYLSESLLDTGVECSPYHPAVRYGLMLLPMAIGAGAALNALGSRALVAVGFGLLAAPVSVLIWAGIRGTHPVSNEPRTVYEIKLGSLPELPSYRGLRIGDSEARMRALLGPPDRVSREPGGGGDEFVDYTYGADTITFAVHVLTGMITRRNIVFGIVVRDPRAQTTEGVGIGDSLELFKRAYPDYPCFTPLGEFDPVCDTETTLNGVSGYAYVVFENDPIDAISFEGLPVTP